MEDAAVAEDLTVQAVFLFFNLILPVSLEAALFIALDFSVIKLYREKVSTPQFIPYSVIF